MHVSEEQGEKTPQRCLKETTSQGLNNREADNATWPNSSLSATSSLPFLRNEKTAKLLDKIC